MVVAGWFLAIHSVQAIGNAEDEVEASRVRQLEVSRREAAAVDRLGAQLKSKKLSEEDYNAAKAAYAIKIAEKEAAIADLRTQESTYAQAADAFRQAQEGANAKAAAADAALQVSLSRRAKLLQVQGRFEALATRSSATFSEREALVAALKKEQAAYAMHAAEMKYWQGIADDAIETAERAKKLLYEKEMMCVRNEVNPRCQGWLGEYETLGWMRNDMCSKHDGWKGNQQREAEFRATLETAYLQSLHHYYDIEPKYCNPTMYSDHGGYSTSITTAPGEDYGPFVVYYKHPSCPTCLPFVDSREVAILKQIGVVGCYSSGVWCMYFTVLVNDRRLKYEADYRPDEEFIRTKLLGFQSAQGKAVESEKAWKLAGVKSANLVASLQDSTITWQVIQQSLADESQDLGAEQAEMVAAENMLKAVEAEAKAAALEASVKEAAQLQAFSQLITARLKEQKLLQELRHQDASLQKMGFWDKVQNFFAGMLQGVLQAFVAIKGAVVQVAHYVAEGTLKAVKGVTIGVLEVTKWVVKAALGGIIDITKADFDLELSKVQNRFKASITCKIFSKFEGTLSVDIDIDDLWWTVKNMIAEVGPLFELSAGHLQPWCPGNMPNPLDAFS